MERMLTIAELAKVSGIPESTVRRYTVNFERYIPSRNYGRATKYPVEVVQVLQDIAAWYRAGHSTGEVEEKLSGELPITVNTEQMPVVTSHSVLQQVAVTLERIAEQDREILALRQELAQLRREHEEASHGLKQEFEAAREEYAATKEEVMQYIAISRVERNKKRRWWWPL